jgi:hypothetical protein
MPLKAEYFNSVASWQRLLDQVTDLYQSSPYDPDRVEQGLEELHTVLNYVLNTYDAEYGAHLGSMCMSIADRAVGLIMSEVKAWKRRWEEHDGTV